MKTHILGQAVLAALVILLLIPLTNATAAMKKQTLGIFGNANEDGVIDMRDVTFAERVTEGLTPGNRLADADHNEKTDIEDIRQIEDIIGEREARLTILDHDGDAVDIRKPVRRIIPDHLTCLNAVRILNGEDRVVGIDTAVKKHMGKIFLRELDTLPLIGSFSGPDYEAVLSLQPDLYLSYRSFYGPGNKAALQEKLPGVTVVETGYYTPYNPENLTMDMRLLGYILDEREQAEAYIAWYNGYLNMIKQRVADLPEKKRPKVYPAPGWDLYNSIANFQLADIAGGRNICAGLGPTYVTVDPEWVIRQNPQVILKQSFSSTGYDTDDPSGMKEEREQILNRPELSGVDAVKSKRVHLWHMYTSGMFPNDIITLSYIAKWLHPDIFADLDPMEVHQEYLDTFSPLDFNVKQHGVFLYPPLEN
ncbi:ABC transporter substrate-binding protein [Desulfospira joergensenii]|uniref:ABC transporter substrate-binding protein n=1 Tax=Desulfospira joergensenii TaxID=53329 RepID=UPI0003B6C15C|nr:ABC transporter substrate-binding protein [Desulfospira joergensenii]